MNAGRDEGVSGAREGCASTLAGMLLVTVVGWAVLVVLTVLGLALGTSRYADWRTVPAVWWTELVLAVASGAIAVATVVVVAGRDDGRQSPARQVAWAATGLLAGGAIGLAAAWIGLQVPTTPGHDVLSRGEPMLLLASVPVTAVGAVVAVVAWFLSEPPGSGEA